MIRLVLKIDYNRAIQLEKLIGCLIYEKQLINERFKISHCYFKKNLFYFILGVRPEERKIILQQVMLLIPDENRLVLQTLLLFLNEIAKYYKINLKF